MVSRLMTLLGLPIVLSGLALTCDLQNAYAKKKPDAAKEIDKSAVNNARPAMGNQYNVWRGKTHDAPRKGHIEGAVVYIYEVDEGEDVKLMASIFLYEAEWQKKTGAYKLKALPRLTGELRSRLPSSGKGHGKNRYLNLVLDTAVPNSPGLRRRIILTASRSFKGAPNTSERSVRLVTSTYEPKEDPTPSPDREDEVDCGDEVKSNSTIDSKGYTPCSDFPDDAVMIEETITAIDNQGTPDPDDEWMEYPKTEWQDWEAWP